MKREEFLNYPWHDAEILSVVMDRRCPGDKDTVDILVRWPDGSDALLRFVDCYGAELQMNFGVRANESILSVDCVEDRQDVVEIKKRWASLGVEMSDLTCFEIETNATGSRVRVYAKSYVVKAMQGKEQRETGTDHD